MIIPVILAGGSGTRLWPLSREMYPKQLLPLVGERTMLQNTLLRLQGAPEMGEPLVVCNSAGGGCRRLRGGGAGPGGDHAGATGRPCHPRG